MITKEQRIEAMKGVLLSRIDACRSARFVRAISVVNRWLGRRCRSMRLARWSGRFPVVNGGSQPVLGCGSQFSRGLQRPAKKRVLRFLAQGDKAITVAAIELDTIANSAGLLAKHARAGGTADFDLVFHHGGSSNERGSIARGSLRNGDRTALCFPRDPNPNPMGFGLLAFVTFWPAIVMIVVGWNRSYR